MAKGNTLEEQLVKNIEDGIRAINMGVKHPTETLAPNNLNRLKSVNEGLYQDLIAKYKLAVQNYNAKKK